MLLTYAISPVPRLIATRAKHEVDIERERFEWVIERPRRLSGRFGEPLGEGGRRLHDMPKALELMRIRRRKIFIVIVSLHRWAVYSAPVRSLSISRGLVPKIERL
jgi:hypothetical protein